MAKYTLHVWLEGDEDAIRQAAEEAVAILRQAAETRRPTLTNYGA